MAQSRKNVQQPGLVDDKEIRISVEKKLVGVYVKELEKKFLALMGKTAKQPVVLDLKNVDQVDSCGVALCLGLFRECQTQKSVFHIETNPDVYKLFKLLKLTKIIDIREGASA